VSVALGIIYHLLSFCGSLRDYKIHTDMEIVNTAHTSKGIEHTTDMRHIVICDLQYFYTLSHKWHNFQTEKKSY